MARQRAGLWTPTNRVRKCSHRISGRPVWDHYFFGRSSQNSETPITTAVHRDLSSSSLWQVPATIPASTMRQPSRPKMRPSHFRPACLGPIIFSAGPREAPKPRSRHPSVGTFHRPACGRFRRPSPHRRCGRQATTCEHKMKRLRLKRPFSSQGWCGSDCRCRPLIAQIEFDRRKPAISEASRHNWS